MKIYVINLDAREDRLKWSSSQASKFEFSFERFPAITAQNLTFDFVTQNVGACYESHRALWRSIAASEHDYALVLEDDFDFKKIDFGYINEVLESSSVDLIQIGFLITGVRDRLDFHLTNFKHRILRGVRAIGSRMKINKILSKTLIQEINPKFPELVPANFRAGAHAYIVSKEMASSITRLNEPVFLAADDFLMSIARMRTFRIFRLAKSVCGQISSQTSISERFKYLE